MVEHCKSVKTRQKEKADRKVNRKIRCEFSYYYYVRSSEQTTITTTEILIETKLKLKNFDI